jgi:hypothetical protein
MRLAGSGCGDGRGGRVRRLGQRHDHDDRRYGRRGFSGDGASANLAVAGSTKLTLRLPAAAQNRFRLLLKPGQLARAVITVKAANKAGHTSAATRTVAVR